MVMFNFGILLKKCHIRIFNTVIQFAVKQYHLPASLSENKNNDVFYR